MSAGQPGLIGGGAMAQALAAALAMGPDPQPVGAALVRRDAVFRAPVGRICTRVAELIACRPSIVAECAGHQAVRDVVPVLLAAGVDVVIASVGALADQQTHDVLLEAAARGRSRLSWTAGAVGGLDVLGAARRAGLASVLYIGRKPPAAWDAPECAAPEGDGASRMVFEGSARDAARRYPRNANVAAAVALAGLGFDKTCVRLVADPRVGRNVHEIRARGAFGAMKLRLTNAPLPANPKTSWLAALSLEAAIRGHLDQAGRLDALRTAPDGVAP